MLGTMSLPLRALALGAVAARGARAAESLDDLLSMSDEELMKGTQAGGSIPAVYKLCPRACDDLKPSKWTIYSDYARLSACDQPMLFDFAIYNPLEDPSTTTRIRVCSLDPTINATQPLKRSDDIPRAGLVASNADLTLAQNGSLILTGDIVQGNAQALGLLKEGFRKDYNATISSIMFSYYRNNVAAVYAGTAFDKGTIPSLISSLTDTLFAQNGTTPQTVITQLCGKSRTGESTLGAIMTTAENIGLVQNTVKSWADGKCADLPGMASTTYKAKVLQAPVVNGIAGGNATHLLTKRARPVKNADGSCAWYTTIKDDNCDKIGRPLSLTSTMIHSFNIGKTWGWKNCESLQPDMNICLSDGEPPVPAPIAEATCGPTVPETVFTAGKALKDYNPCPLNVCCNVWGNCGLNQDFCVSDDGPSPGTSNLRDGCISNCGNKIIQSGAPASYQRIGYFETWNVNRPCLNMKVKDANTDGTYTHIHWAFVEVSPSFATVIKDPDNQWNDFKAMKEKRVISFGGWAYSTEASTYEVLRQATNGANRVTFANQVVDFLIQHNLDGVDFDWEYPGAPDIPGIPPGLKEDGLNYLKFLMEIRKVLNARAPGKTLSIAAPASYWYLRAFPIDRMAAVLDYIVYMTYDLHGQWDAGNKWSIDGCEKGNCVRSHVNKTETLLALSMITKAGVASNKIFVGESSYGRSFKLSQGGCRGFFCTFTGDRLNSNAAKGKCTDTAGYISDGEIADIAKTDPFARKFYDAESDSDIMIYGPNLDEWVAHMAPNTKQKRREVWRGMNFAGTIDWAVDLQGDASGGPGGEVVYVGTEVYTANTAQCFGPCTMVFPPSLLQNPTVISIPPYTSSLEVGRPGPGGSMVVVTRTITVTIQPVTVTEMPYGNVRVSGSSSTGAIVITPSIDLPLQTVVVTGPDSKMTTRTVTLPPWPWVLSGVPEKWTSTNSSSTEVDENRISSWFEFDAPDPIGLETEPPGPEPTWTWPPVPDDPNDPEDPDDDDDDDDDDDPWPPGIIWPVRNEDDPKEDKKKRVSCRAWFFFVCISWGNIKIDFWSFDFPSGSILPPGPPPPPQISLPPGFKIVGTPKWPKITIGPDGVPTVPPKPSACTPTSQAKLEITTLSYRFTVTRGTTRTTATETISTEFPILGCEDMEATRSQSSCASPTPIINVKRSIEMPQVNETTEVEVEQDLIYGHDLERRAPGCSKQVYTDAYLIPNSPTDNIAEIRHFLEARQSDGTIESFVEVGNAYPTKEWTAFFYVKNAKEGDIREAISGRMQGVPGILEYVSREQFISLLRWRHFSVPGVSPPAASRRRSDEPMDSHNGTEGEGTLLKREMKFEDSFQTDSWAVSTLSVPPGKNQINPAFFNLPGPRYGYYSDPSSCEGQFVYVIEGPVQWSHAELSGFNHYELQGRVFDPYHEWMWEYEEHGTAVASIIAGSTIGVCRKGTIVSIRRPDRLRGTQSKIANDQSTIAFAVDSLVLAMEDIAKNADTNRASKSVINMSWGMEAWKFAIPQMGPWKHVLRITLDKLAAMGVVLVTSAGNDAETHGDPIDAYPTLFQGEGLTDMIVVGAASYDSRRAPFSQTGGVLTTYGGGFYIRIANSEGGKVGTSGTSFAAPQVAALIAYLRALPAGKSGDSSRFTKPADVKKWVQKLSRKVPTGRDWPDRPPMNFKMKEEDNKDSKVPGKEPVALVWNGQVGDHSCIVDDSHPDCVKIDINDPTPVDGGANCNTGPANPNPAAGGARRRSLTRWVREVFWQNGDAADDGSMNFTITDKLASNPALFARQAACPVFPQGPTKTVSYRSGSPSPTCNAAAGAKCGKLCKDSFYCYPSPGVKPPDFSASQPSGGGHLPDLPTLPPDNPWFPTSPGCMSWTIPGLPTLPPNDPWFPTSPPGGSCLSSATRTSIGGPGGNGGQATITSSGCVSWSTPKPDPPAPPPDPEPNYPYMWYVYMASDSGGEDEHYLTFTGSPDCKDVLNARTLVDGGDLSNIPGWHAIRCVGCSVCMPGICGNDRPGPSVMEIRTPSTHVTWYLDRNGDLVDLNDVPGGRCEVDTSHDFWCPGPLSIVVGSRMIKCRAVFSQASLFS
ncbi:hypothetical protein QBC37DRAFT_454015, partial [Rhypophila decipiens]